MSIARMSLLEIVAPSEKIEDLLVCMQGFGGVHLEEVPLVVPGVRSYLHRQQLTDEEDHRLALSKDTVRMVAEMLPLFKGESYPSEKELAAYTQELPSEDAELMNMRISRLKRRADSLWRKQSNISTDIATLESYRDKLDKLNAIKDSSNFSESMTYVALLVSRDDKERLESLEPQLNERTQNNVSILRAVRKDDYDMAADEVEVIVLAFPEEYESEIHSSIRRSGIAEFRMPRQARDLPLMEAAETLKTMLETLPEKLDAITKQVNEFKSQSYVSVIGIESICNATIARLAAKCKLAHSDLICVAQGWAPTRDLGKLRTLISSEVGDEVVIAELPISDKAAVDIPVHLQNAQAFKPFEQLVRLFSNPLYGSMDPTALIAVVFPIFFGLILGDAAYGLAIMGLGFWARRKWRHNESFRDVAMVAVWCGLSSVFFGVIFGEFLGDLPHQMHWLPIKIGDMEVIPVWNERKKIIPQLLMLTIAVGFFHIVFGLVLGVIEAIRLKNSHHLGERLGLLAGLLGIVGIGIKWAHPQIMIPGLDIAGGCLLGVSVILLIKFTGPTGPIELISLVAKVLSYSRIMALGVAGMVIAELANGLLPDTVPLTVRIVVAIPIHFLALALGMMEPAIHALRLHFVEFLPNFFAGDGRVYTPLTKKGDSL
ncbi:hypothetical protein BVX99_02930 [bacterium F16]|nr:hypothetical protein BVX99_02930 [bacterium F16]